MSSLAPDLAERSFNTLWKERLRRVESTPDSIENRLKSEISPKLRFLFEPHPYKVAYSGRYATKSWSFAQALLVKGIQTPLRILCARETQKSIADSVHRLLSDQIIRLGIQQHYQVQKATISGTLGTEFFFAGLRHNISNIKSIEGADIVWVEEAQTVSKASWDVLIPTIRKAGSEIWVSFNPELATDDTYVRFVLNPPPGAMVAKLSWRDNPWFTQGMRIKMEHLRATDPDTYEHVYEGATKSTVEGAVYKAELLKAEAEGRIMRVPYDPTKPVSTFWDLGYGDMVSIWFAQAIAFEYRIIDYYENSHQAIDFYLQILQGKGYTYDLCVFPWDGGTKQLGSGRSIEELTRAKGFKTKVLPKWNVADGINAVRTIFPQCYFDAVKCADGLQGLRRYQWGPPKANGVEKREPLHDAASHPADAFRTLAASIRPPEKKQDTPQRPREHWQGDPSTRWMG